MSLFGSLFTGVSGLNAQGRAMGMISDNVANVNTTAYRGTVANFSSLVTAPSGGRVHHPGGVRALPAYTDAQGLIQGTTSSTDVAISGAGFFVVNDRVDGSGEQQYTRAGSFSPDSLGNLRTPAGAYLQGWRLDVDGDVDNVNELETVNVRVVNGLADATTRVTLGGNLDADQAPHEEPYAAGDMAAHAAGEAGVEPHFARDVRIYDSLGRARDVTAAFLRVPGVNEWRLEIFARPEEVEAPPHEDGLLASGSVVFDDAGAIDALEIDPVIGDAGDPVTVDWRDDEGAADSAITFELDGGGEGDGLSQFSAPSAVSFLDQNGAAVGELQDVRIDEEGVVIATFSNGRERRIYQLPVATFPNPGGLEPRSGNLFAQTDVSGEVFLSEAGTGGAGTLAPSALEGSNVDLADEFTKMIVTQRAYSASARIITSTDEMLEELIRIRR